VYLFDVETRRPVATCEGHTAAIVSLGWRDDGLTLISGSTSEVCVWDALTGRLVRTIAADGGAISTDGLLIASRGQTAIRIRHTEDGKLLRTIVTLRDKQYAAISPDGHFSGSPGVEQEFVYVVQTDTGQETLTPDEFAAKYGWENDPNRMNPESASVAPSEGRP
jgi:WD40 repeat protein